MEVEPILLLGEFLRSAAGSDNDSKAAALFQGQGGGLELGALERLGGGAQGQRKDPRNVLTIFFLDPRQLVETRNLAANLHPNRRRIKPANPPHPPAPSQLPFA